MRGRHQGSERGLWGLKYDVAPWFHYSDVSLRQGGSSQPPPFHVETCRLVPWRRMLFYIYTLSALVIHGILGAPLMSGSNTELSPFTMKTSILSFETRIYEVPKIQPLTLPLPPLPPTHDCPNFTILLLFLAVSTFKIRHF